jgi:hypothetical protein
LNTWTYSLQGIYDKVPFKTFVSLFEKYPDRNPNKPFTEEEIKGELGNTKINETETLADICKKRKGEVGVADFGVNRAVESMKERGIETENKTLGKFVYHDYAKYKAKNKKEYVVTIPNALGFLATKANGYDTYVVYNSKRKNFC